MLFYLAVCHSFHVNLKLTEKQKLEFAETFVTVAGIYFFKVCFPNSGDSLVPISEDWHDHFQSGGFITDSLSIFEWITFCEVCNLVFAPTGSSFISILTLPSVGKETKHLSFEQCRWKHVFGLLIIIAMWAATTNTTPNMEDFHHACASVCDSIFLWKNSC